MPDTDNPLTRILGAGPSARALRDFARRAAAVEAPVLITGETGTGKGLLARVIHDASPRAAAPFIAVNCAGVPESLFESEFFGHVRGAFTGALQSHRGLIEQADRGTLFLDEIAELPLGLQAKLLTVLEDREFRRVGAERAQRVDFRLIAAAGVHLDQAVAEHRFRADLYHRLRILFCLLPPLRERAGEIPLLAEHFRDLFARKYARHSADIAPDVIELLSTYSWPGNIRELAHCIEAAVIDCENGNLATAHFRTLLTGRPHPRAGAIQPPGRYSFVGTATEELRIIEEALRLCRGNKTAAARRLGMSRNTLLSKLRRPITE